MGNTKQKMRMVDGGHLRDPQDSELRFTWARLTGREDSGAIYQEKWTRGAQMTHQGPLIEEVEFSKSAHCSLNALNPQENLTFAG